MRYRFLDALKALAIIGVVGCHVTDGGAAAALAHVAEPDAAAFTGSVFARIVTGLAVVNLFFMASGAVLLSAAAKPLDSRGKILAWYGRRFGKLLPPFIVWSYLLLGFRWLSGWGWPPSWREALLLPMGTFYHLWFMYMLFALYLSTPLLLWARRRLSRTAQWGCAGVLLLAGSLMPVMEWHRGAILEALPSCPPAALVLARYVLGFACHAGVYWAAALFCDRPAPSRARGALWLAGAVAAEGLALAVAGRWLEGLRGAVAGQEVPTELPALFISTASVFSWAAAFGLFQAFRGFLRDNAPAATATATSPAAPAETSPPPEPKAPSLIWRLTARLSRDSFGIYLLHVIPVWFWVTHLGGREAMNRGFGWWIPAATIGCVLASWLAVAALRLLPGRRPWLLPG